MALIIIHPSNISGKLQAPPSKSCMQRACAAALLNDGKTIISNYGTSNDENAAIEIIKQLGATVEIKDNKLIIDASNSKFKIQNSKLSSTHLPLTINCNESGLALRMFTPIVALLQQQIIVTGEGSLLNRPIHFFEEILPQLNVNIESNNGKLPITIKGSLLAKNIEMDGSISSQFLTGLLLAFSFKNETATIKVNNLKSKPYIDLTLQVMQNFGLNVPKNNDYKEFVFNQKILSNTQLPNEPINYNIEGDWSNAAFLLVAGAIAGKITVEGLNINSTQADRAILEVLKKVSCNISINSEAITVSHSPIKPKHFYFDATDCPDLFPPLVTLASYCDGISTIKGVSRLQHKESNRAIVLQEEFGKMGIKIDLENDTMFIDGSSIKSAIVNSHNDHRIAMACAVAALKANGKIMIENGEAVNKSYPNFYSDLSKLGVQLN